MTAEEATFGPPLPPGTFRIDREGSWRHEGQEVTHPGVLRNLYANLGVESDQHYLQVGPRRVPVEVDDAPFVVSRVEAPSEGLEPGALMLFLSDGTSEPLSNEGVWVGARETPYCQVKAGRFRARLSLAAWLQLAPLVQEGASPAESWLVVGRRRFPLRCRV